MWRIASSIDIKQEVKNSIHQAFPRAHTLLDILNIDKSIFAKKTGMPMTDVDALYSQICSSFTSETWSLPSLLTDELTHPLVSVGNEIIDLFLGETFLKHALSILSGPPGSGKTQFTLSMLCWCIRHHRKVLYIQHGCSFVLDRVIEMLQSQGISDISCLQNLYIENVDSAYSLFDIAEKYANILQPHKWGCIIVDSITPLFLPLFSFDNTNGRSFLTHLLLYFRDLCIQFKLPIIMVNQTRKTSEGELRNALHSNLYYLFDCKLDFLQKENNRVLSMDKSPDSVCVNPCS